MQFRRKTSGPPGFDDQGFALLEVLISICVLLVAAFALTTMNAGTWKNTEYSKSYTEASVLAARNVESLISEKFASTDPNGCSGAIKPGSHPKVHTSDGRYTVTYFVADDNIMPDTKTVQMIVSFARGSATKKVHFNYLLPVRR